MKLPSLDFESSAYTNFATPAAIYDNTSGDALSSNPLSPNKSVAFHKFCGITFIDRCYKHEICSDLADNRSHLMFSTNFCRCFAEYGILKNVRCFHPAAEPSETNKK